MQPTTSRPVLAACLVLASMALFGLIDNFMRLAAGSGGLWQFHFLRAAAALAILIPLALLLSASLRPRAPGRVLLRSVLNSFSMVIYFGCLGFMPIAQVVAGLFTAPIFVVLFSVLLFGERVSPRHLVAVALGFLGILLALRPETGDLSPLSALPVLAGAFYGLGNLVTRRWLGAEGTVTLLTWFFALMLLWGGLGSLTIALWPLPVAPGAEGWTTRGWVPPEGIFLALIHIQAVGSIIGVGLSIRAYQLADATLVAVFENSLLVFATLWAIVLWREVPDALSVAGLALIAAAGVVIALPVRAAPAESRGGT
jgi:drug/metabolite transporter (DMT)-like permease